MFECKTLTWMASASWRSCYVTGKEDNAREGEVLGNQGQRGVV